MQATLANNHINLFHSDEFPILVDSIVIDRKHFIKYFSIAHAQTMSIMELSILYLKGSQVDFLNYDTFLVAFMV